MKTVIVSDGLAVFAGDMVELFEDHAAIDGTRYLCFNDSMQEVGVDALPSPWVNGAYRLDGDVLVLDEESAAWVSYTVQLAAALAVTKAELAGRIDDSVADVYSRWLRFDAEYVAREAAARTFIADGTPSDWVTGFAVPAGLTEAAAAALIVQQADNLRTALEQLGAQRMRKYLVMAASTEAAAQGIADDIFAQVKTIAAGLA